MYCSKCGQACAEDQDLCPKCGTPTGSSMAALAAEAAEQGRFERTLMRLSRFWLLFAGLNLALGAAGWLMAQPGPWEPWPHPPLMQWTLAGGAAWTLMALRLALAAAAGLALRERAAWGRPTAIAAGVAALTQFPIGLVLGAYTIVTLSGRQNAALYEKLA